MARRTLREHLIAAEGRKLGSAEVAHVARMAVINSKRWPASAKIRCRFLDGSPKMRKQVERIAHQWEQYANIKFSFVSSGSAEVRISFHADDGSWSAVGQDALNTSYFPLHQPTMNFGWLRDGTSSTEYSRVVLHEFGHALGCVHEHEGPKFPRKWNVAEVLRVFQGPPNYWSPADIRSNVLDKYRSRGILTTEYDPKSIMLYAFDAALFLDGKGPTNSNSRLSAKDKAMIRRLYPG